MDRFTLYKPEIEAIGNFFTNEQNLSVVRVLGKEIFWVDSASLQQIAKQYQENIRIAVDPNSTQAAKDQALDQLLERTKLVVDDFRDLLLKVEEEKDSCAVPTSTALSDTEKEHLKRACAIEKVSNEVRGTAFQGLTKLFTPGAISLATG